ncbi:MAG TPA: hypothetical protein VF635_03105 [Propionibacteriaceae bacterium]
MTDTVAPQAQETNAPVPLDQPAAVGPVTVAVLGIARRAARPQVPGEVAGPALAVEVAVTSAADRLVDLGSVVVTLADSGGDPGNEMTAPPAQPLAGMLAPGRTARGMYVFTVPEGRRNPVTISVSLAGASPVLTFRGDAT